MHFVCCLAVFREQWNEEKLKTKTLSSILKTGVPAQLLDNRPDVMQAEFAVMSAYETTSSARAYFYPALTLTASTGFRSCRSQ